MTPYQKGLLVSQKPDNTINDCPFQYNSNEYKEWWEGYAEGTKYLILKRCTFFNEKHKSLKPIFIRRFI